MRLSQKRWILPLCLGLAVVISACTSSSPSPSGDATRAAAPPAMQGQALNAGVSADVAPPQPAARDERLGTQWGESIVSQSTEVQATRLTKQPLDQAMIAYSAGSFGGQRVTEIMLVNGRIGLTVLDGRHRKMQLNRVNLSDGYRLQGVEGERYQLQYRNYTKDTIYEVIASVDGVDVLTGKPASVHHAGYVLHPGETLRIEGFRKSQAEVAAFRFSASKDSYAANSPKNSVRNTGVIGSAFYEIAMKQPMKPYVSPKPHANPNAFPADNENSNGSGYAKPPQYR